MHRSPDRVLARRRPLLILAAVVAAAAAALGAAQPASADDAPVWTVRTAANDLGSDRSSFSYTVQPGEVVHDAVVVTNRGAGPIDLAITTGDARTTADGRLDVVTERGRSAGVAAWTRSDRAVVSLRAGQSATVPFTVAVPDAARAGDYVGAVLTSTTTEDDGADVVRRLGIRTSIRVTGDLVPAAEVTGARVTWDGALHPNAVGTATVTYTVRNTGNMVLDVRGGATATGPLGHRAGAREQEGRELLPGEHRTITEAVPGVVGLGPLDATASVTPTVTDAAGTTTDLEPVTVHATTVALPWVPMLLALVVVLGVLTAVLVARRRRRRPAADVTEDQAVPTAS